MTSLDSHSDPIPGKTATIVRLVITGLVTILLLIVFFSIIPSSSPTLWIAILNVPIAIGSAAMFGAFTWGLVKWTAYIFPKARRWGKRVCSNFIALSLYGLAIKLMVRIYIIMLPIVSFGIALAPMALIIGCFDKIGVNIITSLLSLILGVAALGILVILDYAKLTRQNWKDVLKKMFSRNKNNERQPAPQK